MTSFLKSFILLVGLSIITKAHTQIQYAEDKVKWSGKVEQTDDYATVIIEASITPNWEIGPLVLPKGSMNLPTVVQLVKSKDFEIAGPMTESKPHSEYDKILDETLVYHVGKAVFKQKIKVLNKKDFVITFKYEFQTCEINAACLPPYASSGTIKVKGNPNAKDQSVTETAGPDTSTTAIAPVTHNDDKDPSPGDKKTTEKKSFGDPPKQKNKSLSGVFIGAFLSGFLALIMPCVFPMIPMTVSFFTKRSKSRIQGIRNAFIYGGSIVLIHVLLGGIVVITGAGHILNELSTNVWFNIFFFLMLFLFGLSFLGAFEIRLPSKWVNSADAKADKGGIVGIFFMALVLSLASFSCTGPILGGLLGGLSAYGGGSALMVGMFAFGLALALPFMLFSIFPSWLNSMPNSGGWLNVVKVFLGFLEIAFAFKFLSTADTTMQWHILEREIFISIWIAIFGTLTLYLFGKFHLPHDSPVVKLSVGRTMTATLALAFTLYLVPGLWGAPLKLINAFLPPDFYAESPKGFGSGRQTITATVHLKDGMHEGPQGLPAFTDYDKALAYAKKVNKPLFVDFTGWGCVNCRKMEQSVWGEPGIIEKLRDDVVIVSLYVDERTELPKKQQKTIQVNGRDFSMITIGNKWTAKQIKEYQTSSQPYYVLQTPDGEDIPVGSADYQNHGSPEVFKKWLEDGLKIFRK
ncbi:cytochrome c biogenesis protein CcdA [Fluviicola sp.]|jgi:thiol:disulfide interchange protein DsbD|uniref:protein-disulfide reductase DsbD family protein n=1 Tax=Fluviicola sp. TaxID=1917219 RepID=UPI0028311FD7|nr:cytochrome c biogenesis protein CcdA [Fluviicola sp.]MDR0801155.1 thioredoxin family protein [Fluviicola sp.]